MTINYTNQPPRAIALDGPAASGKSTVGQRVAQELDFLYFDTGAMYRALTWLALDRDYDVTDEHAMGLLAENVPIEILPPGEQVADGRQYTVQIEDEDVTWNLRRPRVDAHVSVVAAHPAVRRALVSQQRRVGLRGDVIMVGRDIGTVVMPDAPLKIFLDASPEERARRRYEERLQRGQTVEYEQLLAALRERDRQDSTRATSPLRAADDAWIINSSEMTIDEVVTRVLTLTRQALGLKQVTEG